MAYITRAVDSDKVLELLKENHSLEVGDAAGRISYTFEEISGGRQTVKVELTYVLATKEVDSLLR